MSNPPTALSENEPTTLSENEPTTLPQNEETTAVETVELRTPTLITEQEVRFSTAVALAPSIRRPSRGARVVAAIRRTFALSPEASRPTRRHYPRRYTYLEDALMSREMDRL